MRLQKAKNNMETKTMQKAEKNSKKAKENLLVARWILRICVL